LIRIGNAGRPPSEISPGSTGSYRFILDDGDGGVLERTGVGGEALLGAGAGARKGRG